MRTALKAWAGAARRDLLALALAARDPRVPLPAKLLAAAAVAYALSPIDLIPDFVPVLGYLDDLVLVPLALLLAVRLIPKPLFAELRLEAARRLDDPRPRGGAAAAVVVVAIWLVLLLGAAAWLTGALRG